MSTTLETAVAVNQNPPSTENAVDRLRFRMAASRVSFTWFGTTKTLTDAQKATAARSFGANGEVLSAGKKLLDTKHPAYKEVSSIKNRITCFWKGETLPFPQPGIRLIRQDRIESFNDRLTEMQEDLVRAVDKLDRQYSELKQSARDRLGDLFNESDYPESLAGLFGVRWDFPSVEPPDYLRRLNPRLYEQEAGRVSRRFDQALEMAEAGFMEELQQLIAHLTERLTGQVDGKPKIFRDSAIANLNEFFKRFRRLNVRSNEELDGLVETCQQVISGRTPQSLRENRLLRDSVADELHQVGRQLDQLLVDRPRRNLLRKAR